jgi:hypothetical protein
MTVDDRCVCFRKHSSALLKAYLLQIDLTRSMFGAETEPDPVLRCDILQNTPL